MHRTLEFEENYGNVSPDIDLSVTNSNINRSIIRCLLLLLNLMLSNPSALTYNGK